MEDSTLIAVLGSEFAFSDEKYDFAEEMLWEGLQWLIQPVIRTGHKAETPTNNYFAK